MWEKAGQPDGADFSNDARKALEQQVLSGKSLQELERALKSPEPQARAYSFCAQCLHICSTAILLMHGAPLEPSEYQDNGCDTVALLSFSGTL